MTAIFRHFEVREMFHVIKTKLGRVHLWDDSTHLQSGRVGTVDNQRLCLVQLCLMGVTMVQ